MKKTIVIVIIIILKKIAKFKNKIGAKLKIFGKNYSIKLKSSFLTINIKKSFNQLLDSIK